MKDWNIKQLNDKRLEALASCHNAFERSMVNAIAGKEIREAAEEFAKARKLTPGELAIAGKFGYR